MLPATIKIYMAEIGVSGQNYNDVPPMSRTVAVIESNLENATIKAGIYAKDVNLEVLSVRESYSEVI